MWHFSRELRRRGARHSHWSFGITLALALWLEIAFGHAQEANSTLADLEKQIVATVAKVEKSVVAIARVRKERPDAGGGLAKIERLLKPSEEGAAETSPAELGAGVILDSRGLVLTTYHLLGEVKEHEYAVWFNRRAWPAKVKAADPWFDLAILEVEADDWPAMSLASVAAKRGQFVIALGNPFAIARDGQASSTWGTIANLSQAAPANGRGAESKETVHHYGTLLQTDARLELAASGGALVNLEGELVGLSSTLVARAGSERPGSLAIPVDEHFLRTLALLKQGRVPDYGFLGIAPTALAADDRKKGMTGALVSEIVVGTPAARAGMQVGDIVTTIDDLPVANEEDFIRRLSSLHAGTPVILQVLRGSFARQPKSLTVKTRLTKKPFDAARPALTELPPPQWRGMRIDYATAAPRFRELARELDAAGSIGVIAVERDSPAWLAGLRPGDFVSHVGKSRVTTPEEFWAAVEMKDGEMELKLATGAVVRKVAAIAP